MPCADKFRSVPSCPVFRLRRNSGGVCVWLSVLFFFGVASCDRIGASRYAQLMQDGDAKSAQGDFARAINLYEAALEDSDSTRNAEVHYKLALLYDDRLNDPVGALHHFRRYLALSPNCREKRRKLAALLWGDATDETLLDNLRASIFKLRKAFGDSGHRIIASEAEDIALAASAATVFT